MPDVDGPAHAYLEASPGCWGLYGEWMAERAYTVALGPVARAHHVDAYAAQHPGGAEHDRRQRQSVAIHLVSLCLLLEHDQDPARADRVRGGTSRAALDALELEDWPYLTPPADPGGITIADVTAAAVDGRDDEVVQRWVATVWAAWAGHHEAVRSWARVMRSLG